MRRLSFVLLTSFACAAPGTSAADPPRAEPARMNIEASSPDAPAQWAKAAALLTPCAPADVTVWYALGSARVKARPEKGTCRVDVETEVEGDARRLACAMVVGTPWSWDLVSDGGKPRATPPRDPPPSMAAQCK